MKRSLPVLAAIAAVLALVLSACSGSGSDSGSDSGSSGKPQVVTSTDVWAAVASAVAGDKAEVTALYTNPEGDPHEFEPSAADTAKVADASVVVENGGDYDPYMDKASQSSKGTTVNAFALKHPDGGKGANEHVFYDLATVGRVADKIADALADKDSANASTYRANAEAFTKKIDGLRAQLAAIKTAHDGARVAQTEPLAAYLLTEAGITDAAPEGFTSAVEEGQSPSAGDRAAMEGLLRDHKVSALVYNTQAVDSVTQALLDLAKSANVPVVQYTETLPKGVTDYITWQTGQITALQTALGSAHTHGG